MFKMLTIRQASKETGLSYYCLSNMIKSGKLPVFKSGNRFLINSFVLEELLKGGGTDG